MLFQLRVCGVVYLNKHETRRNLCALNYIAASRVCVWPPWTAHSPTFSSSVLVETQLYFSFHGGGVRQRVAYAPEGHTKKWLRRSDRFFVEALGCKDPPTFSTFEAALKAAMKLVDASNSSLFAFLTGAGGHVKDKRVLEKAHAIIERHKAVGRGPGLHAYFSQQVKQRGASGSPFERRLGLATAANGCASVQELDSDSEEAEAEGSDEQNAAVKPELPQGEEDERRKKWKWKRTRWRRPRATRTSPLPSYDGKSPWRRPNGADWGARRRSKMSSNEDRVVWCPSGECVRWGTGMYTKVRCEINRPQVQRYVATS